jgi:hypothetical protein
VRALWVIAALVTTAAASFAAHAAAAPPSSNTGVATDARSAASAHTDAQKQLEALLSTREDVLELVRANDLAAYRKRIVDVQGQIDAVRVTVDRAFLVGAWKSANVKRAANDLVNRVQTLEILSRMASAIVNGYDYPAGKVPASAADATTKLYAQLARFTADVQALNKTV